MSKLILVRYLGMLVAATLAVSRGRTLAAAKREGKALPWSPIDGLLAATAILLLVRFFLFEPNIITSRSMQPTLMVRDIILTRKLWSSPPEVGAIVTFEHGAPPRTFVKRLLAGPGMEVRFHGNDIEVLPKPSSEPVPDGVTSVKLGVDEFFVAGDNRGNSRDSRSFGPVKSSQLTGTYLTKLYSH